MTDATELSRQIAAGLRSDWATLARPEQLAPPGDWWSIWLYLAGRGAGKTRSGIEWVLSQKDSVGRIALVAPTVADCRDVLVEGASGILACAPSHDRPVYEISKRRVSWANGSIATLYSSEEPDRLRGPQHGLALCDELAAWQNGQATWDMLSFGLRAGQHPRICITTTPRPTKIIRNLVAREGQDVVITRGRTADNAANLAPSFLSTIVNRYAGTRLGRQELEAELLSDAENALWSFDVIESTRVEKGSQPEMKRIVIGVDPAASVSETSDETGIIVAGIGTDGAGYVLEDCSGKYSPIEWARKAVGAYRRHRADTLIAESNMGGLMVSTTLRSVDRSIPCRLVHASRGKVTRAEPISSLYEQGRVHHCGVFSELEDQMTTFEAGSQSSPDRLDALVWAMTDLMVGFDVPMNWTAPFEDSRPRNIVGHQGGGFAGGIPDLPEAITDTVTQPGVSSGAEYQSADDSSWAQAMSGGGIMRRLGLIR